MHLPDSYYIQVNGEQSGPFTLHEMMQRELDVDTLVLQPQTERWQRASDLPEFFEYFESRGINFPTEDNLATFWWRLLAYLIDSVFISVVISVLASGYVSQMLKQMESNDSSTESLVIRLKFNLGIFVVSALYNALLEVSPIGGSLGKRICRLTVVDADGRRLSFIKALVRNFTKLLSSIVFGIGYLNILWDEHRQGWHDQIAKSYVIRRSRQLF